MPCSARVYRRTNRQRTAISSLTVALLRLADETDGTISIDGVDTASVSLQRLRSSIALIPQAATMFAGSLKHNLDPTASATDAELWSVLREVGLDEVATKNGGLTAAVAEEGSNWSAGQRQLLCIGRALLRQSKIVLLDEATASCDVETDQLVQQTVRRVFRGATVLTVAHRLNTIADSDTIMVLDKGKVCELGPPAQLLARPGGRYQQLVADSNE